MVQICRVGDETHFQVILPSFLFLIPKQIFKDQKVCVYRAVKTRNRKTAEKSSSSSKRCL